MGSARHGASGPAPLSGGLRLSAAGANVAAMRLTEEDLAQRTLARQFPGLPGRDAAAVLELFRRLGPVQSQVPRSPFLTVASRLPGVDHAAVSGLFAGHALLKTSSLRGTVHTSGREHYPWLDAVARRTRAAAIRSQLRLHRMTPEELVAELEAFADDGWRHRDEIVAHARRWLLAHGEEVGAAAAGSLPESLFWGHSGLLRRPRDGRWERRTDVHHRRARAVDPGLALPSFEEALTGLVRVHLAALGPATRQDLAYFHGTGLTAVDTAVRRLGGEVLHLEGPDGEDHLDLAGAPTVATGDLGVRLLPEFDALLVGYHGRHRTRFLSADQLEQVWAKVNGQFAPVVLRQDRLVGTWRTVAGRGRRARVEVTAFPGCRPPAEDELTEPVAAVAAVLDLEVEEVRVLT